MENVVKTADIFREVLCRMNLNEEDESNKRRLNNKLTFLFENVALQPKSDYKAGRDIKIPACDAPIVRNLLMLSIDDSSMVYHWFNNNVDMVKAEDCLLLYGQLEEPIKRAEISGETDSVTVNEWLGTIKSVLSIDMANKTIDLKKKLEQFRSHTIALDSSVSEGDIYCSDSNGSRSYLLRGNLQNVILEPELLETIVSGLYRQSDYFDVLNQIIDKMNLDSAKKAIPEIEQYAYLKKSIGYKKAKEIIGTVEDSIVSEYFAKFQRIAEYLHENPQIAYEIEEKTNTSGLEEFFRMKKQCV